eukprot:TRINITY_DN640_c0_g2_i1.p1 TRINITY_DN640_c0_g2~~TRINITY_DN640_c0_g2_i1.p1  ORF type:complete len:277 (+),score=57.09 TRINITY_DN640_c0_g2_i1:328-1158(+)
MIFKYRSVFSDCPVLMISESFSQISSTPGIIYNSVKYRNRLQQEIGDQDYQNTLCSEIVEDFLFLGRPYHACDESFIEGFNITHVLNVSSLDLKFDDIDFEYTSMPPSNADDTNFIDDIVDVLSYIENLESDSNNTLLIICNINVNYFDRSVAVTLAYFMKKYKIDLISAWNKIKEFREFIRPHPFYISELLNLEFDLRKKYMNENDLVLNRIQPSICFKSYANYYNQYEDLDDAINFLDYSNPKKNFENIQISEQYDDNDNNNNNNNIVKEENNS